MRLEPGETVEHYLDRVALIEMRARNLQRPLPVDDVLMCTINGIKDTPLYMTDVAGLAEKLESEERDVHEDDAAFPDWIAEIRRRLATTLYNAERSKKRLDDQAARAIDALAVQPMKRRPNNPNITCYRCGQKGHIRDHCSTPPNCTCTFCHCKGHLESVCQTKERAGLPGAMVTNPSLPPSFTLPDGYALIRMPAATVGVQTTTPQSGPTVPSAFQMSGWSNKNCILDSGSDENFTPNKGTLLDYIPISPFPVKFADGPSSCMVIGMGTMKIQTRVNGVLQTLLLPQTLFAPDFKKTLLSVGKIQKMNNMKIDYSENGLHQYIKEDGVTVAVAGIPEGRNTYHLVNNAWLGLSAYNTSTHASNLELIHRCLGHVSIHVIKCMARFGVLEGLSESDIKGHLRCEECIRAKLKCHSFAKFSFRHSRKPLDLVHTDVMGPFEVESIGKARYAILFIDDATKFFHVYPIRYKSDVITVFRDYKKMVEALHNRPIGILRSDNGGEYTSQAFTDICKETGTLQQFTSPGTPEENGTAERGVRSLTELMRVNLLQAKLPKSFWGAAIKYAAYTKNRVWTKKMGRRMPAEAWHGTRPTLSTMRTFGCKAFLRSDPSQDQKLSDRAQEVIYLGQRDHLSMGYVVLDPSSRRIRYPNDLVFFEDAFPGEHLRNYTTSDVTYDNEWTITVAVPLTPASTMIPKPLKTDQDDVFPIDLPEEELTATSPVHEPNQTRPAPITRNPLQPLGLDNEAFSCFGSMLNELRATQQGLVPTDMTSTPGLRYNLRNRENIRPDPFIEKNYEIYVAEKVLPDLPEPLTMDEARQRPDWNDWLAAMLLELESLKNLQTYELVKRKPLMNVLRNKWVFTYKRDAAGRIERYKA